MISLLNGLKLAREQWGFNLLREVGGGNRGRNEFPRSSALVEYHTLSVFGKGRGETGLQVLQRLHL